MSGFAQRCLALIVALTLATATVTTTASCVMVKFSKVKPCKSVKPIIVDGVITTLGFIGTMVGIFAGAPPVVWVSSAGVMLVFFVSAIIGLIKRAPPRGFKYVCK